MPVCATTLKVYVRAMGKRRGVLCVLQYRNSSTCGDVYEFSCSTKVLCDEKTELEMSSHPVRVLFIALLRPNSRTIKFSIGY